MRHQRVNYIAVGLFVLAMLGSLLYLLFQLTGKSGPGDDYHVIYKNVGGLKFGTPVYYEGYHIGQVEAVEPLIEKGKPVRFKVDMSVTQGWQIPKGSQAQMSASGLLGTLSINIRAGDSPETLQPGARIDELERADLFAVIADVAAEIKSLSKQSIRPLLANMDKQVSKIGTGIEGVPAVVENARKFTERLLGIADSIDKLVGAETERQVRETLDGFKGIASDARKTVAGFKRTPEDVRLTLARYASAADEFRNLATQLQASRKKLDGVLAQGNTVLKNADKLVQENRPNVREALTDLRKTMGYLAARADTILYNLDETSRNLKEFTRLIRQDPSRLISKSKGGKEPKVNP